MTLSTQYTIDDLPGLDCGVCGMRSCEELAERLPDNPELIKRCIYLSDDRYEAQQTAAENQTHPLTAPAISTQPTTTAAACAGCAPTASPMTSFVPGMSQPWRDSLGREIDFYLEHFPEEPGPR